MTIKHPEHFLCYFDDARRPLFLKPADPTKLTRKQREFIHAIGAGLDERRVNAGGAQTRMAWRLYLAGLIHNCSKYIGARGHTTDAGVELTPAGYAVWRAMKIPPNWPGSV